MLVQAHGTALRRGMFDRGFMLAIVRGLLLNVRHVVRVARKGPSLKVNQEGGRTSEGMERSFIGLYPSGQEVGSTSKNSKSDRLTSTG